MVAIQSFSDFADQTHRLRKCIAGGQRRFRHCRVRGNGYGGRSCDVFGIRLHQPLHSAITTLGFVSDSGFAPCRDPRSGHPNAPAPVGSGDRWTRLLRETAAAAATGRGCSSSSTDGSIETHDLPGRQAASLRNLVRQFGQTVGFRQQRAGIVLPASPRQWEELLCDDHPIGVFGDSVGQQLSHLVR